MNRKLAADALRMFAAALEQDDGAESGVMPVASAQDAPPPRPKSLRKHPVTFRGEPPDVPVSEFHAKMAEMALRRAGIRVKDGQ